MRILEVTKSKVGLVHLNLLDENQNILGVVSANPYDAKLVERKDNSICLTIEERIEAQMKAKKTLKNLI